MKTTLQEDGEKMTKRVSTKKVVQGPREGKWFKVDPETINQELFEEEREDQQQEETRRLILEAFEELKNNPEKYGRKFKTMMPKKNWHSKTVEDLEELAYQLGDHNADWVEQALEWAQRICNGESWVAICNNPDTANWYRLVIWKDGYARIVGGSRLVLDDDPASGVYKYNFYPNSKVGSTVPLVVLYEE